MCRPSDAEAREEEDQDKLLASPLSVDSLSGIYLGFSEKDKKEEREEREEKEEREERERKEGLDLCSSMQLFVVEDDLRIEEAEGEAEEKAEGSRHQGEKVRSNTLLLGVFRIKRSRRPKQEKGKQEEQEEQESASCFQLFRRTLNLTDCDS